MVFTGSPFVFKRTFTNYSHYVQEQVLYKLHFMHDSPVNVEPKFTFSVNLVSILIIKFSLSFFRRKLSVRIQELEDLLSQAQTRASNLEKAKNRLTQELREVTIELENVSCVFHDFMKDVLIHKGTRKMLTLLFPDFKRVKM